MNDCKIKLSVKVEFAYGKTKEELEKNIEEWIKNGYEKANFGHFQTMVKIIDSGKELENEFDK